MHSKPSVLALLALLRMQYFAPLEEAWILLLELCVYTHFAQKRRRLANEVMETGQLWFLMDWA